MTNAEIRDDQWKKMYSFLQHHPRAYTGKEEECRLFVEAVHWILRSGAQWVLEDLHQHFAGDPDMENLLLDSTIVRAHPCAAGARKKAVVKKPRRWDAAEVDSAPRSTPA
jgi:hypothetical protein